MTGPHYGHITRKDGSHELLSPEDAEQLWKDIEAESQKRAEDMPTFQDALREIMRAEQRMKDLGWREARYCPRDGSTFAFVRYGSTGMMPATYTGEWPTGVIDLGEETTAPEAGMWKALDKLSDDEKAMMDRCVADEKQYNERMTKAFAKMAEENDQDR